MPAQINVTSLRTNIAVRVTDLAVVLLGKPNRAMSSKRELRFGRHGSLSVVVSGPKAGMWHDHQLGTGGDMLNLIERERGGGFRDAVKFAEAFLGQTPRAFTPTRQVSPDSGGDPDRNSRVALDIWEQASPIAGTDAARYLARRGLEARFTLRHLPPAVASTWICQRERSDGSLPTRRRSCGGSLRRVPAGHARRSESPSRKRCWPLPTK